MAETEQGNDVGRSVIGVTGILANGKFFSPVRSTLLNYGDVTTVSYTSKGFNATGTADELAAALDAAVTGYDQVVVIAVSMGGLLILDALQLLNLNPKDKRRFKLVVIDAPSGVRDFDGPNMPLRLINQIGARTVPYVPKLIGDRVLPMMLVPPKDENIEYLDLTRSRYEYLARQPQSQKEFIALVKEFAMENMRETPFARYVGHMTYLTQSPASRPWAAAHGIEGVYMACTSTANETICQLRAAKIWTTETGLKLVTVEQGAHAAWAEMPIIWAQELGDVLDELTAS